jgi:hypothetical protein
MPLWFGFLICLRGLDWLRKSWGATGNLHLLLGLLPLGLSFAPLVLKMSPNNQSFGLEHIYELSIMGIVIIAVSILEHLIILKVENFEIN